MAEKKKKKGGPQISLTWIYAVIAITLGYLLMSGDSTLLQAGSSRNATYSEFKNYVRQGYASRIIVDKKDGVLQMYVEPSHIRDVFREQKVDSKTRPYVVVQIPSADKLEDFISEQQEEQHFLGEIEYRQGSDDAMHFIWSFGPLILIAVFWLFLMRRMSGMGSGEGGGPMGIFNVGKSRARLVEKDEEGKVTLLLSSFSKSLARLLPTLKMPIGPPPPSPPPLIRRIRNIQKKTMRMSGPKLQKKCIKSSSP